MARVLVVDDEVDYCTTIASALSEQGHEVATATRSQQAIEVGQSFVPDVLVADWMLKNTLNGLEVSAQLKDIIADLRTVLISGFPSAELTAMATKHQVSKFLEKPFEPAELISAVEEAASPPDEQQITQLLACGICEITLPIRKAQPDEQPSSWACAFCGNRFKAIFEESAPPEVHGNVRKPPRQ